MILFIRIPKNASTSLYHAFGKNNIVCARLNSFSEKLKDEDFWQKIVHPSHIGMDVIVKYLGKQQLDLLTICCIRNPYDRIVSAFTFTRKHELWRIYSDQEPTFRQFAEAYCNRKEDKNFSHAHSQTKWITFEGRCRADVILRFEHLEEDFNRMNAKYKFNFKIPHLNSTEHKPFHEYYDDELGELVFKSYEEDFENLGYHQL